MFYRLRERVRLVSRAVLLRLLFELGMVIELGTPHPTYLPDAARSFGPNKCTPSECFCQSAMAVFSGNVRSTETRFSWITAIHPRNHFANSLFRLRWSPWALSGTSACIKPLAQYEQARDARELAKLLVFGDSAEYQP